MTHKIKKRTVKANKGYKRSNQKKQNKKFVLPFLVFVGILTVTALLRSYYTEEATFNSGKYYIKGIDISHHNPILDWKNLENQNITFAYIKSTEGTSHQDRNYPYNYKLAKETNVKVGSYHFYTFALSGKEQANHFLQTAKFNSGDLLPAIDVEHSTINQYSKDKKYIAIVIEELKVLENEIYEHLGIHPVIYTNKDCYKLYIEDHFPENMIWMCDLHNEPSDKIQNWKIWQFSHKGELNNVDGHIDLNYYRYSFDEFKELLLP